MGNFCMYMESKSLLLVLLAVIVIGVICGCIGHPGNVNRSSLINSTPENQSLINSILWCDFYPYNNTEYVYEDIDTESVIRKDDKIISLTNYPVWYVPHSLLVVVNVSDGKIQKIGNYGTKRLTKISDSAENEEIVIGIFQLPHINYFKHIVAINISNGEILWERNISISYFNALFNMSQVIEELKNEIKNPEVYGCGPGHSATAPNLIISKPTKYKDQYIFTFYSATNLPLVKGSCFVSNGTYNVSREDLLFASKNVYALNSSNGSVVWSITIPENLSVEKIIVSEDKIFIISFDNNTIFALNSTNGDILWNKTFVNITEVKFSDDLFILHDGKISKINESNGDIIKTSDFSAKDFELKNNKLFAFNESHIYSTNFDEVLWNISMENETISSLNFFGSFLFVESETNTTIDGLLINESDGKIVEQFVLGERNSEWMKAMIVNDKILIGFDNEICALGISETILTNLSYLNNESNYSIIASVVNYGDEKDVNVSVYIRKIKHAYGHTYFSGVIEQQKSIHLDANETKKINFSMFLDLEHTNTDEEYDLIVVSIPNSLQYLHFNALGKYSHPTNATISNTSTNIPCSSDAHCPLDAFCQNNNCIFTCPQSNQFVCDHKCISSIYECENKKICNLLAHRCECNGKDADGNGKIEISDAFYIIQGILGFEKWECMDVNIGGNIDIFDVIDVLEKIAGNQD